MVKKTKRNNKLRGGFSWPWSKKVDEYGNPVAEEETTGFLSYFTGSNQTDQAASAPSSTNTSYLGLENIKMPEMPAFSNPFASSTTENSTVYPTKNSTVEPMPMTNSVGGKRRSIRRYKGGYRGLGLTYYATPVDGIKVAEPTYMEYYTGGKRGKKTRKQMRKKCRKNCRKSHRHIR